MRSLLADKARKNDRSLSKEIVSRLRKSLEQELAHEKRQA
ncbi:Arc family DNA-binding protein [Pseudomonas chlororaphis]